MTEIYNFIGSWQLFPEKGNYESGTRPKSGICSITATEDNKSVNVSTSWVTLENQAFAAQYKLVPDGNEYAFDAKEWADAVRTTVVSSLHVTVVFYKAGSEVLKIEFNLLANGYLKITQLRQEGEKQFTDTEVYHKQMSVLPYASSAAGALVKPNEEGMIRHKALSAMEEQTNMQLDQIRKQIELLAQQAQEIQKRKELSFIIYNAKLSFSPVIGSVYYLYQNNDETYFVSMIGPGQWSRGAGYKEFIAKVKLLADHTWVEVE